jgi:hypothetical protein
MSAQNAQPGKGTLRRVVIITAIVAAGALVIAAIIGFAAGGLRTVRFGGSAGTAFEESKSLQLGGVDLIEIRTVSEDIKILEGTGESVQVRLHGTVGTADGAAIPHLSAERKGNTVDIRVERERTFTVGLSWNNLVLEVSIPKGYARRLSITAVSADIEVPDSRAAELSLATTSGTLRVGSIGAEQAELSSVSGDISVGKLTGSLRAHSTSGDISVSLPAEAGFRLDARSVSGRVSCGFPIQLSDGRVEGARHAMVGTVGSGRDALAIDTVSGDIAVKR